MKDNMTTNAAGREVLTEINGRTAVPYQGVGKYRPEGRKAAPPLATCADYPEDGNKVVADLKTALQKAGLRDGMTISSHHHFRNGDLVANKIFDAAAELGVKDLRWFPSASFPCHEPLIRHLDNGVIHHIEGSMNGPLGAYLVRHRLVPLASDTFSFRGRQGEAIGRPGTVEVTVEIEAGAPETVRVAGRAVIAFEARLRMA